MKPRILIAEDSAPTREQLRKLLEADDSYSVDTVGDGEAAWNALKKGGYSVFLTDLKMPKLDGMQLIERVREKKLPVAVIVMTGFGSIDEAVKAIRLGASDFLTKPVDIDHLRFVIERTIRERGLQEELTQLRQHVREQYSFGNVLSKSAQMRAIFGTIKNIAATTTTVLIEGETGTGKEMVARAVHEASSPYRSGAFVAINCAALPENLLESELFGHEKGSFTGAVGQRKGRFELANGGTLFLDEVGDIPASMQVKLLRVLQERKFERVGGGETLEVDVRVVGATNRNLLRLVKKGTFREDLYYRLNVVKMDLPPLRKRLEDIPLLATHFATKYARPSEPPKPISPAAMDALLRYQWPGNIRELENAIERACVTARGESIEPGDLPADVLRPSGGSRTRRLVDINKPLPKLLQELTAEVERRYLRRIMRKCRGNVGRCAELAGLSRRSISAKLAEYGINKDDFKRSEEEK